MHVRLKRIAARAVLSVAAFALAGCAGVGIDESTTKTKEVRMHAEANKALVTRFFKDFSDGNIDAAFALVREDVVWWVPGTLPFSGTKTKPEYLRVVSAIKAGFPRGLKLIPGEMTAEANRVAVEVESYGEHANGKTYRNKYHFLIYVEDGRFVNVKEYMDTQHLEELIGR